ncbi:MAG: hypothetical protein WB297_02455 [Actinomycetota bacterium]
MPPDPWADPGPQAAAKRELIAETAVHAWDWMAGGFQDALVSKDLDPGLLHRHRNPQERRAQRIDQFVDLLRRSLGADR